MTQNNKLSIGQAFLLKTSVTEQKTASVFAIENTEHYANVLSTPHLIADMERACAKILEPVIKLGQVSVGAHIDVRHLAATNVGANYTVLSTLVEKRWGLYTFDVLARDSVSVIGKGRMTRAITSLAEIESRGNKAVN